MGGGTSSTGDGARCERQDMKHSRLVRPSLETPCGLYAPTGELTNISERAVLFVLCLNRGVEGGVGGLNEIFTDSEMISRAAP